MIYNRLTLIIFSALLAAGPLYAAKPAVAEDPAIGLTAVDMPYDVGYSVMLRWPVNPALPDDTVYRVFASDKEGGVWVKVKEFPATAKKASDVELPFWAWDGSDAEHAVKIDLNDFFAEPKKGDVYNVKLTVSSLKGKKLAESKVLQVSPQGNWFRLDRLNNLLLLIVVGIVFFWAVSHAKRKGLFIRRIAGLDAIDEAIGRATEMGKPIYYVPGIGQMVNISTIASAFILGEVSKKVAQYDSTIKIPHYDAVVMTVCKEVVKQSYLEAGRPDSYREDMNFFVSQDQFSYAASVDGMISREKPAACFFMGYFMAESLLLAEVGATTGAIQIAGTDIEHQLPFFFTACDYTLIGEELYAAGAYLSREPMLLSALKVQDFGKLVVMVSVFFGAIIVALGTKFHWDSFVQVVLNLFKAY